MKRIPFKKIFYGLIILFIIIQFIHPSVNNGNARSENDISHMVNVPDSVMKILEISCFDCHSNHTEYPWYHYIQPVTFYLDRHVNDGKRHLNFSEYNNYNLKRKKRKLEKIAKEVEEHGMPLWEYTLIHTNAKLNDDQTSVIINWAKIEAAKIIVPDSLKDLKETKH